MSTRPGQVIPYRKGDGKLAPEHRAELERRIRTGGLHPTALALGTHVSTLEKAASGGTLQPKTRERLTAAIERAA